MLPDAVDGVVLDLFKGARVTTGVRAIIRLVDAPSGPPAAGRIVPTAKPEAVVVTWRHRYQAAAHQVGGGLRTAHELIDVHNLDVITHRLEIAECEAADAAEAVDSNLLVGGEEVRRPMRPKPLIPMEGICSREDQRKNKI